MACAINITAVNGIIQPGQINPSSVRVLGTAFQCPGSQVLVTSPAASGSQTATVNANGRFRAELLLPAGSALQCGQVISVRAECAAQSTCFAVFQKPLECCQVTQLYFQAVTPLGSLVPNALLVSGTLLGCPNDIVVISSSVTASTGPIAVDPMTGAFRVQIPTTAVIQCDDLITLTANCGASSGCTKTIDGRLFCTDCYRAAVAIDATAPCTGTPPTKPITLTASIAIAAGTIQHFHWDFGDGTSGPTFTINNTGGTAATAHVHTETHTYAPGTYTATLKINPPPYECAEVTITVVAQCSATGCPAVVVDPPQIAQTCINGKRTVTLTSHITAPAGPPVFAQWNFGDSSAGLGIVVNGGSTVTTTQMHDYTPGNYTAQLMILSPGGCLSTPIILNVPPCAPPTCHLAVQNVSVQIGPCNPMTGTRLVTATASVNNTDPADLYYWQWDSNPAQVGLPPSQGTTQQHQYLAPSTGQSTYDVTLTVIRGATCVSSFTKTITIDGCGAPCPQLTDITVSPQACVSNSSTTRPVDLTAQTTGTTATTFEWDFGDGSPLVTSPTPSAPRHDYAAPGTYTARVKARTPNCPDATAMKSVMVAGCGLDGGGGGGRGAGGGGLPSCAILLWMSLILMLVGAIASVVGCVLAHWLPQVGFIVGIIGIVLFAFGALLFLIWWIVCRFLTLCAVILAARDLVRVLIAIFVVVTIIIGIASIFIPSFRLCAAAAALYGFAWGAALAILDFIADGLGCLIRNPSGGSSLVSSFSELARSARADRLRPSDFMQRSATTTVGLGDIVSSFTSTIGIKPCAGCMQRAQSLNRRFPLTARSE